MELWTQDGGSLSETDAMYEISKKKMMPLCERFFKR